MKRGINTPQSLIKCKKFYKGESLEEKMRRVIETNEPIKDGAPQIFTERKAGVIPAYNIRTDRWEIAQDAMDKANKTWIAERDAKIEVPQQQEEQQQQTQGKED